MKVSGFSFRVAVSAVLTLGALAVRLECAETGIVLYAETHENKSIGETCGWDDGNTLKGGSFLGVSGETASPRDGGFQALKFKVKISAGARVGRSLNHHA